MASLTSLTRVYHNSERMESDENGTYQSNTKSRFQDDL